MTDTIQLDSRNPTSFLGYESKGIVISPEPVRVGQTSTITLSLQNCGRSPIIIGKIEPKVAEYGIGVAWSNLPTIDDQLLLPVNRAAIKTVSLDWTPERGGSRCFRAFLHTNFCIQPLCVGRNLQIIESAPDKLHWQVPFKLGNPRDRRMPVYPILRALPAVSAQLLVQETRILPGQPVWLDAGEEVDGVVLLAAQTEEVIHSAIQVEAVIGRDQQFLDGLLIEVSRPAYSTSNASQLAMDRVILVA